MLRLDLRSRASEHCHALDLAVMTYVSIEIISCSSIDRIVRVRVWSSQLQPRLLAPCMCAVGGRAL